MTLGGGAFFVVWLLNDHFAFRHSWLSAVIGAAIVAVLWTILMGAADRSRRRRGKSPLYPDGSYRQNVRQNWAVGHYSAVKWLGFAGCFVLFVALAVAVALTGSLIAGVVCAVLFGGMTLVCVVQAIRAAMSTSTMVDR